ncbi:hypothetical protein KSP40_PGU000472 [Platanthera guangdongensis]|uniref:Uncharacterized protein n=1 Tax=Platanthera guangdongensis TaxID=2320717 RepID=A0ABR2MX84_9ASPA
MASVIHRSQADLVDLVYMRGVECLNQKSGHAIDNPPKKGYREDDDGLKSVLLTGGIPPIGNGCSAETMYKACFEQVVHQNEKFYRIFPQDIPAICELVNFLSESKGGGVPLPAGGILTPKGLQVLGLTGLGSGGDF